MNICSVCHEDFASEAGYLEHTCTTNFTPTDVLHLGPEFLAIQRGSLERGLDRAKDGSAAATKTEEAIAQVDAAIEALPEEDRDRVKAYGAATGSDEVTPDEPYTA